MSAANIAERFDRTGGFTGPINDPLAPPGWVQGTLVTTVTGGNPAVEPEKADTFTAGIVYRPTWAQGLDMSVDWLSVDLEGAIEQLAAQNVVNQCHLDGDQDQCAKIIRDPTTNFILFIPQVYENLSKSKLEAIDAIRQAARKQGFDERIYVRGDKTVDYGTMMKIMGRLSAAGFRRVDDARAARRAPRLAARRDAPECRHAPARLAHAVARRGARPLR